MSLSWKFSGSLNSAHSNDIKAVSVGSKGQFVTAGRDGAVKLWQLNFDKTCSSPIQENLSISEHEGFVNSVALLEGLSEHPEGMIVSGGGDKLINLWDCRERKLCGTLVGMHEDNICKLVKFKGGGGGGPFVIGSCSWDGSVRCWTEEFSEINSLKLDTGTRDSGSCWSICALGPDSFVTGHADRSIRVWRGDRQVNVIASAHGDVVRDLLGLDGGLIVSVGNDGVIKLWNSFEFECVDVVPCAHPAFIYGVCGGRDPFTFATFGEEGIVKIWHLEDEDKRRITLVSEIRVPIMSVWSAAFVDDDLLIIVGSTGTIFLFSTSEQKWCDSASFDAELSAFEACARASKASEIEKSAQDPSILRCPGERIGKTVIVKGQGCIEAHQWDGSEWINLGEVVDPNSVKAPDFTFNVELDDTGRSYSLPYNIDENPYSVAKNFLDRNDLPITHLDEVAAFIIKNSGVAVEGNVGIKDSSVIDAKLSYYVIDAYNAEGVSKKLKAFGMTAEDESLEGICVALKSWSPEKLFPCLDWLRYRILEGDAAALSAVSSVPFDRILDSSDRSKEVIASVTMALRVLCNATAMNCSSIDSLLLIRVIGKCTLTLNVTWIPLLIGLIGNCSLSGSFDASKAVPLLHGLLSKINKSGIDTFGDLTKGVYAILQFLKSKGQEIPMSLAVKNEISLLKGPCDDFKSKINSLLLA